MKKNKNLLPNNWDFVELFLSQNIHLKYCFSYKCFYTYINNRWIILSKDQLYKKLIDFLKKEYPNSYKKFNLRNLDDIILLIMQNEEFSMNDSKILINKEGFLLPFNNGILNTNTLEFFNHDPKYFVTHIIPIDYSKEDSIQNTIFSEFLSSLVNYNTERLRILRVCLNLLFTNNLNYQLALYIYGPGGTGKSTLMNILMYLLGSDACLSTSLSKINSRFGLSSLIGKILLILNDVSFYRGVEPKTLKEIITQDRMQGENKYQPLISFNPNAFVILTSNILWELKNSTTGISRRMIYFPFENIPKIKDVNLFKLYPDGDAFGTLVPFFSGFIN
jgi:P4 family phage/plasmid primase-like protien